MHHEAARRGARRAPGWESRGDRAEGVGLPEEPDRQRGRLHRDVPRALGEVELERAAHIPRQSSFRVGAVATMSAPARIFRDRWQDVGTSIRARSRAENRSRSAPSMIRALAYWRAIVDLQFD